MMGRRRSFVALLVSFALFSSSACSVEDERASEAVTHESQGPLEVPVPDLSGVEPQVVRLIEESVQATRQAKSADSWGHLAMVYDAHGYTPQAIDCYRQALGLDPSAFRWNYHQAILLDQQAAELEEISTLFEQAARARPDYALVFYRHALAQGRRGNAARERDLLERALARSPDFPAARRSLGQALMRSGELDQAIDHLQRAVKLDPVDGAAHAALAQALMQAGKVDEAKRATRGFRADDLVRRLPDPERAKVQRLGVSAVVLAGRARAAMDRGQFETALGLLEESDRWHPGVPSTQISLGICYRETGKPKEARESFERAIALSNHPRAHWQLGAMLLRAGESDAALGHLDQALAGGSEDAELTREIALLLAIDGRLERALEAFQAAADLDPRRPKMLSNWGVALVQSGQPEQALEHFQRAIELLPDYSTAYVNAGLALERLGRTADAIEHFRRAVALDANATARQRLEALTP